MSAANRHDVLLGMRAHVHGPLAPSLPSMERTPAPWESSMQATCECLSWRGTLDNQLRRHTEDELGETLYAEFPVHTRSALVAAHTLLDKGIITEDELRAKLAEVRSRLERV